MKGSPESHEEEERQELKRSFCNSKVETIRIQKNIARL